MKNIPLLLAVLFGTLALVAGVSIAFSRPSEAMANPEQVVGDARHATGSAQARLTIVEFSDLQCPACRLVQPTLAQLKARYPNDIRLVYRHFPLTSIHANAPAAAQLTEGAGSKGKFWEMHDLLFEKQAEWSGLAQSEVETKFVEYGKSLGFGAEEVKGWLTSKEFSAKVLQDISDGTSADVNSTPAFFLNGVKTDVQNLAGEVEKSLQ